MTIPERKPKKRGHHYKDGATSGLGPIEPTPFDPDQAREAAARALAEPSELRA